MVAAVSHKVGRYEIVKHLASGGMAELLLARTRGLDRFERHVVIKQIRKEQAEQAGYVEVLKQFIGKKPNSMLRLTGRGREAFQAYRQSMRQILGGLPD